MELNLLEKNKFIMFPSITTINQTKSIWNTEHIFKTLLSKSWGYKSIIKYKPSPQEVSNQIIHTSWVLKITILENWSPTDNRVFRLKKKYFHQLNEQ